MEKRQLNNKATVSPSRPLIGSTAFDLEEKTLAWSTWYRQARFLANRVSGFRRRVPVDTWKTYWATGSTPEGAVRNIYSAQQLAEGYAEWKHRR